MGVELFENVIFGLLVGGLGVDNLYGFDGVDVLFFMFGNLVLELLIYDVVYVIMDCGGVKVVGFNCLGGFLINIVLKLGIDEFYGNVEYKV